MKLGISDETFICEGKEGKVDIVEKIEDCSGSLLSGQIARLNVKPSDQRTTLEVKFLSKYGT